MRIRLQLIVYNTTCELVKLFFRNNEANCESSSCSLGRIKACAVMLVWPFLLLFLSLIASK